tara:strand:+ start:79 stop:456 length:378 start_codon:yes stop_codon:yes gene_type:complete
MIHLGGISPLFLMDINDPPLFNHPTAPHNGVDTSIDAAESMRDQLNFLCKKVLGVIREHPDGLTCEQVERLLGMKHQTASARLRDLMCLEPCPLEFRPDEKTGKPQRRGNASGRTARVYFAKTTN